MIDHIQGQLELLARLQSRRARGLLLYLLFSLGRTHRNEMIADLLWPDRDDAVRLSNSLRQEVVKIRKADIAMLDISIDMRAGNIKLTCAQNVVPTQLLSEALSEFSNPAELESAFLTYLSVLDDVYGLSKALDSWVVFARAEILICCEQFLNQTNAERDTSRFAPMARLMHRLEPHNETAVRAIMQQEWEKGNATRAIEVYNKLYVLLDDEFDQEPEVETIDLLADIKLNPSLPKTPVPVRSILSLHVQSKEDPDQDLTSRSLLSALVADLRMRLSRFREWQVLDRPRTDGSAIYVRVQLHQTLEGPSLAIDVVRAENGEIVWSEIVDAPSKDWNGKARMMIVNIADSLRIVVSDRKHHDPSASIYDRWLETQTLIGTWRLSDEEKAVKMLREIAHEATDFGPAHAELAALLNVRHILRPGTFQTEDVKLSALSHALDAVTIDPMDTRAHRVLAWCYCHRKQFDIAEFHFEQSLRLNPQNPHTLASATLGFAFTSSQTRAGELLNEITQQPQAQQAFHLIYMAAANYLRGDYVTCVSQCEAGPNLMSTVGGWHTAALVKLGRYKEAQARFATYTREITAQWQGANPASPDDVRDWFVSCFPFRDEQVRVALSETLIAAQQASSPEQLVSYTSR